MIATHSPIVLAYPEAKIFSCGETGIEAVAYEETEPVQLTPQLPRGSRALPRTGSSATDPAPATKIRLPGQDDWYPNLRVPAVEALGSSAVKNRRPR